MKNVEMISMGKREAQKAWEEYRAALKLHQKQYMRETIKALSYLRRGIKLVDIAEIFKQMPLKNCMPQLAIGPAWQEEIALTHRSSGWGELLGFSFPMPPFPVENFTYTKRYSTLVPNIPPHLVPKGSLRTGKYYILWEVENWEEVPKDPILLRRITRNLFAVLASWDLTPLEQAILRGKTV